MYDTQSDACKEEEKRYDHMISGNIYITIIDRNMTRHLVSLNPLISGSVSDILKQVEPGAHCECKNGRSRYCHVTILSGAHKLRPPQAWESEQLLNHPTYDERRRLACQLFVDSRINGIILTLG